MYLLKKNIIKTVHRLLKNMFNTNLLHTMIVLSQSEYKFLGSWLSCRTAMTCERAALTYRYGRTKKK